MTTFTEQQLVRHRSWRGFGRLVRNRLNGEVDVFWWAPNGRAGMRSTTMDMLVPPRRTDTPPAPDGKR